MKLTDKNLALILIVIGIAFVLLPKISKFMGDHPAEGGRMVGGESGGGYFPSTGPSSGFDIPWNLLQQTPDTGYVGMDPPIDMSGMDLSGDEPPIDVYGSDDPYSSDDSWSFWDAVKEGLGLGAGLVVADKLVRKTYDEFFKPKPPIGGTPEPEPTPAPGGNPAPIGIKLPEFDPAYAEGAAGIGVAAWITATLAKWFGSGSALATKMPTAAGAVIITPEMLGAPAGTTQRNIGMYFDQLQSGVQQIFQGQVVQGFSTALIGSASEPGSGKIIRHSKSSTTSVVDPNVTTTNLGGDMLRHHLGLSTESSGNTSTRTERISKVDYS